MFLHSSKIECFVIVSRFHPCLILSCKAWTISQPYMVLHSGRLQSYPEHSFKWLKVKQNTLAYYGTEWIIEVKSFPVQKRKIPDKPFVLLQTHLMQLSNATFGLKTKHSCMNAFIASLSPRHRVLRFPGNAVPSRSGCAQIFTFKNRLCSWIFLNKGSDVTFMLCVLSFQLFWACLPGKWNEKWMF